MHARSIAWCRVVLLLGFLLSAGALTGAATVQTQAAPVTRQANVADFPTVDPTYMYGQLYTMVTRYQAREAGYDSASHVGHKGFADYWSQEMLNSLGTFGASASQYHFALKGWKGRAATSLASNIEVSVPGATHPEQVVVIGCHYDGEAVSTQSAYDDASGCAIELGVAKALANYWHQHQLYPARTIRFVIFDAEEQGLYGSFDYVNHTANGDLSNIVAMFNEEQNGIAYPLRYMGQMKNALMPFQIWTSPQANNDTYTYRIPLSQEQKNRIQHMHDLLQQALPIVFQKFRDLGYAGLTYHNTDQKDSAQPIFTADHLQYVHIVDDSFGSSDQMPFTFAGLPCATFAGNDTYYDNHPQAGSYPYDQREDTIQLMNTFADGSSQKSNALSLALALPGMITTWMLHQSDIVGTTAASTLATGSPVAAIDNISGLQPGQSVTFHAKTAFDPHNSGATFKYNWDFGDGGNVSGASVEHTYASAGNYTLTLTIDSGSGQTTISKNLMVSTRPVIYANPYQGDDATGYPTPNQAVTLPTANDTLSDKVLSLAELNSISAVPTPQATRQQQKSASTGSMAINPALVWLISGIVVLIIVLGVGGGLLLRRGAARKPQV